MGATQVFAVGLSGPPLVDVPALVRRQAATQATAVDSRQDGQAGRVFLHLDGKASEPRLERNTMQEVSW